jgi:hypothetical protein
MSNLYPPVEELAPRCEKLDADGKPCAWPKGHRMLGPASWNHSSVPPESITIGVLPPLRHVGVTTEEVESIGDAPEVLPSRA